MTEKKEELKQIPCIWYLVTFKNKTKALPDLRSEINAMNQAFALYLGLKIWKTNVRSQKIDGTILKIYRMVVSTFSVSNKNGRERLFEESFLLANIKPNIVLGMSFLIMSNADINFQAWNLQ